MNILDYALPAPQDTDKNFPQVAAGVDDFIKGIQRFVRMQHYKTGSLGAMPVAYAGNSFMGYGMLAGLGAYWAAMCILHHDADVIIDDRAYYWNLKNTEIDGATGYVATENYPRKPLAERGLNFGAGGRDTAMMLEYQLKYILECDDAGKMAPVLLLDPWVNDPLGAVGDGIATVDRIIAFCKPILARNIEIVCWGNGPRQNQGQANETPFQKHYIEQRFQQWAEKTPGMHFIPVLDLLKSTNQATEVEGHVDWRDQSNGTISQRATNDDIHYSVFGARLVAERMAEIFRRIVRRFIPPVFDLNEFDEARNPYANLYGAAGRLVGSGGKINGVACPTVSAETLAAGNVRDNMPANVELLYKQTGTFKVTPVLTGNPDEPLWLEYSGTPTEDTHIVVRLRTTRRRLTTQWFYVYGEATWENAVNVAGIALGDASVSPEPGIQQVNINGSGSSRGRHHIMPFTLNERVTLRGRGNFIGAGNNMIPMDLQTAACAGLETTGRLRIKHLGMFRRDNNPYRVAA